MRAPIGVVDSGPGGWQTARAITARLPDERVCYADDPVHAPWGTQLVATVRAHALRLADRLVDGGAKLLVMASPTASAACLADARERYDVPVTGSVRPAVRSAVARTVTGRIGVLTTPTAVASGAYSDAFAVVPGVEVTCVPCPPGRRRGPLHEAVTALRRAEVDTVVLGCAPTPDVLGLLGPDVRLVCGVEETAHDVARLLATTPERHQPIPA